MVRRKQPAAPAVGFVVRVIVMIAVIVAVALTRNSRSVTCGDAAHDGLLPAWRRSGAWGADRRSVLDL
ncbi:hypothetical protein IVO3_0305 [plant metagenome]|uniref:Uncharacterized protein n=3 Tax=plant metagenome TaxID=1297885 RepID=A0A484TJK3_9ZZZZ